MFGLDSIPSDHIRLQFIKNHLTTQRKIGYRINSILELVRNIQPTKQSNSTVIEPENPPFGSDEFSGMIPLSGGNVAYLTLFNRPGKKKFDDYTELQEWVTVTALRFNFDRLNTFGDEVFGDPKVLKSYYIAVSDIAVGGMGVFPT